DWSSDVCSSYLDKKLTPHKSRLAIALVSAMIMLLYPSAWMQILIILAAGFLGLKLFQNKAASKIESFHVKISKKAGIISLLILVGALIALPILNNAL